MDLSQSESEWISNLGVSEFLDGLIIYLGGGNPFVAPLSPFFSKVKVRLNKMRNSFDGQEEEIQLSPRNELLPSLASSNLAPEAPIQPSQDLFQQLYASKQRINCDIVETKQELLQEWKKIYGNKLVAGERLLKVFRCALAKPALLEGKFWISDYHIGFRLNWPSQVCTL